MKKRINIVTLQNVPNYGSVLQAYATQEIFKKLGLCVNFYDYVREDLSNPVKRVRRSVYGKSIIKKSILTIVLLPSIIRLQKQCNRFIKTYINTIPGKVTKSDDFIKVDIPADIYCTGSDQTWNSGWNNGILSPLFLNFVQNGKKISYAASIGKDRFDNDEIEITRNYLLSYHAISVREERAKVMIKEQLGLDCVYSVLDPTLQLDRFFWLKFAGNRIIKEPYCLIYQLNSNKEFDAFAMKFAKDRNLKLVRICLGYHQAFKCGTPVCIPNVEDFVNYISYAEYVITDSFHATAFSINLNTKFIVILPDSYSSRIVDILNKLNLIDRIYDGQMSDSGIFDKDIDYTLVNEKLEEERRNGYNFLIGAIQ